MRRLNGKAVDRWKAIEVKAGSVLSLGAAVEGRDSRVSGVAWRNRHTALPWQPQHFYVGRFWRTCGTSTACRRCAASGHEAVWIGCSRELTLEFVPDADASVGDRGDVWAAYGAGFLYRRRYRDALLDSMEGSLPERPHRCETNWSKAQVGQTRWRRSRVASFEYP